MKPELHDCNYRLEWIDHVGDKVPILLKLFPNGGLCQKLDSPPGDDQGRQGPGHLAEGVQEEDGENVDNHRRSRK